MPGPYTGYLLEELAEICKDAGDSAAWEEFVLRTHRLIAAAAWNTARRWGFANPAILDDLVQEVYLKLSGNLARFQARHPGALQAYLRATAASVAHDYCKSAAAAKRGSAAKIEPLQEIETAAAAEQAGGAKSIENRILLTQIDQALAAVAGGETAQRDRLIFWLYYRHGMTANSISGIRSIGLSPKGVESAIQRITRQVRAELSRTGPKDISPAPSL